MKYLPQIDGLRTVAVVPVILFHGGFEWFSGGFIGVDVFFVISGYLITTILLSEMESGRYSLLRFYERRARRILPALFVVMAACIPFAWMWMLQTQLRDFFESMTTTALFTSNILFWSESGYFAAVAEEKPLLHTWSLAVEEQYYLLFPPLLWLAMKAGRGAALGLILALSVVSLGWALLGEMEPEARFFLSHTRVWELLVGSLCAWVALRHPLPGNQWLSALGLGMVLIAIFALDHDTPYPLFAVLPVVGTALLILFARSETYAARVLSLRPMVAIGLISYSAYLWHQPLFAFARIKSIGPPPDWMMAGLALLALGLAWLSWRFVEQPFRGNPAPVLPRRGPLLAVSVAGILAYAGLGWYGHEQEGFPEREVVRTLVEPMIDARYERFRTWDVLDGKVPARFDLKRFSDDPDRRKIVLLGDSHSKGLFNAFYQNPNLFPNLEVRRVELNFKCYDEAEDEASRQLCVDALLAEAPDVFAEASHALFAARWHRPGRLPSLDTVPEALRQRGIVPILVGMTSEYDTEGPVIVADMARDVGYDGTRPFPVGEANARFFAERSALALETQERVRNLASELGLPFLDRQGLICDDEVKACTGVTPNGEAAIYDYGHWTLAGARYFGHLIAERNWLALP